MPLRRLLSLLVFTSAIAFYYGQNTGTITGTVTDPSGAAIPNVKIVVVQTDTNFESRAVTNAEGIYRVQSLQPGTYRVTFEAAGFKRLVRRALDLSVGDVLPVNATLEVGALTESVQVSRAGHAARNRNFVYGLPDRRRHALQDAALSALCAEYAEPESRA